MGKEKRKRQAVWVVFLQGSMTALWIYLVGIFLVALFLVKGVLPEGMMLPVTAGLCMVASLVGGLLVSGNTTMGTLSASVLNALVFSGILVLAGMACWHQISWNGNGGILMVCAMAGGVLAGVLARPGRRKKKRGRTRGGGGKTPL